MRSIRVVATAAFAVLACFVLGVPLLMASGAASRGSEQRVSEPEVEGQEDPASDFEDSWESLNERIDAASSAGDWRQVEDDLEELGAMLERRGAEYARSLEELNRSLVAQLESVRYQPPPSEEGRRGRDARERRERQERRGDSRADGRERRADRWDEHAEGWAEWGERQGERWGEWGERQGEAWAEWGERFGERWAEWGERFGERWAERAEELAERWADSGERFADRFEDAGERHARRWDAAATTGLDRRAERWEQRAEELDRRLEEIGQRVSRSLENVDWDAVGSNVGVAVERALRAVEAGLAESEILLEDAARAAESERPSLVVGRRGRLPE
ncbi:MAG TPA: hypothetical protein VNB06_22315 [Thermoanaerobaculia bacterium]|nr:hypothetical protein [Thermoanaerobaculia bacterium]